MEGASGPRLRDSRLANAGTGSLGKLGRSRTSRHESGVDADSLLNVGAMFLWSPRGIAVVPHVMRHKIRWHVA